MNSMQIIRQIARILETQAELKSLGKTRLFLVSLCESARGLLM